MGPATATSAWAMSECSLRAAAGRAAPAALGVLWWEGEGLALACLNNSWPGDRPGDRPRLLCCSLDSEGSCTARKLVCSGVALRWDFVATIFRWTASKMCEMRWVVRAVGREELQTGWIEAK